jgi:hypothetical protein
MELSYSLRSVPLSIALSFEAQFLQRGTLQEVAKVIKLKVLAVFILEKVRTRIFTLCGLVIRVLGYRSGGPGSIPGTTRKKSSRSGTGST